ncbi:hypothetical protein QQS21_008960 [Conoideocrella luteorostrata]|uniref:NB-ARC domain-containing protein n=1 Tax=Conoideocrella luteorostrata TaxID=1105319 RepID=A0AAJ0CI51_9HYPO|nr:hypothetical protein QQS21_008960 [Conoideocrella luteorostrata]
MSNEIPEMSNENNVSPNYLQELDINRQVQIQPITSIELLVAEVTRLKDQYCGDRYSSAFNRLRPFLDWLDSFHLFARVILPIIPTGFDIFLGSLLLALETASCYAQNLASFVHTLEIIHSTLPRFNSYSSRPYGRDRGVWETTLSRYFVELTSFCQDAAQFFKRPVSRNILRTSVRSFNTKTKQTVQRLRDLTYSIDQQARVSGERELFTTIDRHHGELLNLLTPTTNTCSVDTLFVGNLPYDNLPARQNPAFIGRQYELELLTSTLLSDTSTVQLPCACLYGLAGVGKTQVALQFAYKNIGMYDAILWVSADSEIKIAGSLREIANGLGLLEKPIHNGLDGKDALMRWLYLSGRSPNRQVPKWLLIFDNVENLSLLDSYWPKAGKGSIIITCRSPEIGKRFCHEELGRVQVSPFNRGVASDFLLSLIDKQHCATDEEARVALNISDSVGRHPLALDMVGCYVRRCGYSLVRFIQQHPSFEQDLLFRDNLRVWSENMYQRFFNNSLGLGSTVYNHALDPFSECLVQMLAFLDADGVPLDFFRNNSKESMLLDGPDVPDDIPHLGAILENPFEDSEVLDQCLESLLDLALITMDDNRCKIQSHRLVCTAARSSMRADKISFILSRIVFFLNSSFPEQPAGEPLHSKWATCEEFASNVLALSSFYKLYEDDIPPSLLLCEIMNRCAWYFFEKAQFRIALDLSDDAILMCERALEQGQHNGYSKWFVKDMISHHINTKASVARELPSLDHGLLLSQQVCLIRRQNKRPDSKADEMWIAAADGNLAASLVLADRAEEALGMLLPLIEREDTTENEDIYLSNICLCYLVLDRLNDAWEYSGQAAKSCRRRRGDNSVQMALALFVESFYLLSKCECNPGTVCRTLLAISEFYTGLGDDKNAKEYMDKVDEYRGKIDGVDITTFEGSSDYDIFVPIAFRQ